MADTSLREFINNYRALQKAFQQTSNLMQQTTGQDVFNSRNVGVSGMAKTLMDAATEQMVSRANGSDFMRRVINDARDRANNIIETRNKQDQEWRDTLRNELVEMENDYINNQQEPDNINTNKTDVPDDGNDIIAYTYKKGDTFGQVLKDLGLKSYRGLWGSNGDVAYYTKQLRQQGIPGMVPIGRTIYLKRRRD